MTRFLVISHDPNEHQAFHDVVDVDLASAGDRLDEEGRHEVATELAERRVGRIRDYADHVATYSLDELRQMVDQIERHSPRDVETWLAEAEKEVGQPWLHHSEIEASLAALDGTGPIAPGMVALAVIEGNTGRDLA